MTSCMNPLSWPIRANQERSVALSLDGSKISRITLHVLATRSGPRPARSYPPEKGRMSASGT